MSRWGRRILVAAVEAGVGVGLADAAVALGPRGEWLPTRGARLAFALALAGLCAAALVLAAVVAAGLAKLALRLGARARAALAQGLAIALGFAAGFALFSGTAMRRSPARPWAILATAALFALLGSVAWSRRGALGALVARRPRAAQLALLVASAALYLAHAFAFVRLYPGLHALAAASAVTALVAALAVGAGAVVPRAGLAVALAALVAGSAGSALLLQSESRRALARSRAPVASYVVRALARVAPRRSVAPARDEPRPAAGGSLDFRGLDVVLVTVDALRPDRLGAYGGPRGLTPAMDAMASRGAVFERAYCTTPHTSYSLASVMTGKPFREVVALGRPRRTHATVARLLAGAGYATAAFFPPAVFNVDGEQLGDLATRGFDFAHRSVDYHDAATRARDVDAFLAGVPASRRVFVWAHFFEPHEPYEARPGARGSGAGGVLGRYDAEVAAVDDALAALRGAFERRGRRAAWVLTADHGEEFGEHGGRFHGTTVYDEQARVPLIIEAPRVPAVRVTGAVSLVDLAPTILAAVGIAPSPRMRGRDLGAAVHAGAARGVAFASAGDWRMVTDGRHKLVCDASEGACELFDLARDPAERRNLVDEARARADELRALLRAWTASHGAHERRGGAEGDDAPPLPPEVERALQGEAAAAHDVAARLDAMDDRVARVALDALSRLDARAPDVRDAIARVAARPSPVARVAALALALLGDPRGAAVAREALGSSDLAESRRAALGLARLGDPAGVPVLCAWLADPRSPDADRDAVIAALRPLRDARAAPTWLALLDDPRLAPTAAEALAPLGDPSSIAPLERVARETRYVLTRRAAVAALVALRAPSARAHVARALAGPEAVPESLALAALAGEPGRTLAGWTGARRVRRVARVALRGPVPRGPAWAIVSVTAPTPADLVVAGAPAHVEAGTQQVRVPVERAARTLEVRASHRDVELRGVLVVPRAR